jgi:DNA polymerase-3 subunit epsilon
MESVAARYAGTAMPARATAWREADLCVLDFETTGLSEDDEIIAFATVPIMDGRIHLRDTRYRFVRPSRMPDADTIVIHGLRREDLADAPPLSEVLDELLEALTGRALVAHVASIETHFLRQALRVAGVKLTNPIIDTAEMAAELFARRSRSALEQIGLTPLAEELGLPVHRPHQADGDALTTAQVFLALASALDSVEPQTVGSLADLRRPNGPLGGLGRALGRVLSG